MMTAELKRLIRSPIVHFVLAGSLLFALATLFDRERSRSGVNAEGAVAAGSTSSATIRVERDALVAFIQSRTRIASQEDAARSFDSATEAVRQDWIDRYVREEVLVREARSLGLDRDDELIRRRLVQQMEFLVEGAGESPRVVSDEEIEAAYRERAEELREPATLRFAHVFVREEAGREAEAEGKARALLTRLNRERVGFDGALALGDRFLYDRLYVDRTLDEVRSHFGEAMGRTLVSIPVDAAEWTGPYRSEHGLHLVLLTARGESRLPTIDEVEDGLREALLREKRERALARGVEAIVSRYAVELESGLRR